MFVVGVWEWSFSSNVPELGTIQDVYGALKRIEEKMVTREDIEALIDSVEILNNPKTMEVRY